MFGDEDVKAPNHASDDSRVLQDVICESSIIIVVIRCESPACIGPSSRCFYSQAVHFNGCGCGRVWLKETGNQNWLLIW